MKISVLQENLAKAVISSARFASTRSQLPILSNILISVGKTKVFVSSTNLEISISTQIGAKVLEEGEICIPARVISELIGNLPREAINLESEKEQLKISASGFSSNVLGMNSTDFPKVPNSINKENSIVLPKDDLSKAFGQVIFSASVDETRPVLTGVLFIWGKGDLTLVATDGFRLSRKTIKVFGAKEGVRIILPKLILSEIPRSDNTDEILINVREKEKQVVFGLGDVILSSRLLEGEYPDFEKIIPKSSSVKILLDKEEFLRAVKLASIFARDAANIVKIKVIKNGLEVTAESGQSGSQKTKVDAKVETGKEFEIAFNYRFLEEFLHSATGEEIKMEFSGPSAPGVFTDTADPSYLHLIMPVKIQD
jgi:DNA polymerase III subunit beta